MSEFRKEGSRLVYKKSGETVWLEAHGSDTFRVRRSMSARMPADTDALLAPMQTDATIEIGDAGATATNGSLVARISKEGSISFFRITADEDLPLCSEAAQSYRQLRGDSYAIEADFEAYTDEKIYGLGQYQHGLLNQKGCVLDLVQINQEISVPFFVSNRQYGFMWHNPAVGRVELAQNRTRWAANVSTGIDYLVTTGDSYADILGNYASITGHAPTMPEWATGFWQCKLRYRTQEELLNVAREYKSRGLPLSVIVVDFFHWTMLGDFKFNNDDWPDPKAMVDELKEMGVELMVSVWPNVNRNSENYREMADRNLLIRAERGEAFHHVFIDTFPVGKVPSQYYDATNPEAHAYLWDKLKQNYYGYGIKAFWLDQCEPEILPSHFDNLRMWAGNGEEVLNLYPLLHEKGIYEGLKAEGETEIATLCRAAWLGSQRYGAIAWSGDIDSTFDVFKRQIPAGLNMAMSGIPWWNSDIGGFSGGESESPEFHELLIRWFQYGVFCPVCRLHGVREPSRWDLAPELTGADNEVWSYGDDVYEILAGYVRMRERLRPYIRKLMAEASFSGVPPMRPLFLEFPDDPECYDIGDTYLFGSDVLVAPVTEKGAVTKKVYLPAGVAWKNAWTDEEFAGGQWITVDAPLDQIPLFLRDDCQLPIRASRDIH